MAEIVIQDRRRPWRFDGEPVLPQPVTTRNNESRRWAEFQVYKLPDGGWMLHRVGMSVVYHRAGAEQCRTASGRLPGDPATVADLPDDAEPCTECRPPLPLDLGDHEAIRYEFPRNSVNRCATAELVVDALTRFRERSTGNWTVKVSEPVAELLDRLAVVEPAFAAAPRPVPTQ